MRSQATFVGEGDLIPAPVYGLALDAVNRGTAPLEGPVDFASESGLVAGTVADTGKPLALPGSWVSSEIWAAFDAAEEGDL